MTKLGVTTILLTFAASACGGGQPTEPASPPGDATARIAARADDDGDDRSHLGAWYGAGPNFPDGQLCVIFCGNGRLFLADKLCTQTDAGDFEIYFTYEIDGARVTTDFEKVSEFEFQVEDPEVARFSAMEFERLLLQKVADGSPLCTSTEVSPGAEDERAAAPPSRCTVTDSNGPLEGGEITTSGCAKDEICVCEAQAGYSCSGYCRPASEVGVVGTDE